MLYEFSDRNKEKEANLWAAFYLIFIEDNLQAMDNAFFDNGYYDVDASVLHQENVRLIKNALDIMTPEQLLHMFPDAIDYLREIAELRIVVGERTGLVVHTSPKEELKMYKVWWQPVKAIMDDTNKLEVFLSDYILEELV